MKSECHNGDVQTNAGGRLEWIIALVYAVVSVLIGSIISSLVAEQYLGAWLGRLTSIACAAAIGEIIVSLAYRNQMPTLRRIALMPMGLIPAGLFSQIGAMNAGLWGGAVSLAMTMPLLLVGCVVLRPWAMIVTSPGQQLRAHPGAFMSYIEHERKAPKMRVLQRLCVGQVSALCIFGLIALQVSQNRVPFKQPVLSWGVAGALVTLSGVVAIMLMLLARSERGSSQECHDAEGPDTVQLDIKKECMMIYDRYECMVVALCGACATVAFAAEIAYLVERCPHALAIAVAAILLMLWMFPTPRRAIAWGALQLKLARLRRSGL